MLKVSFISTKIRKFVSDIDFLVDYVVLHPEEAEKNLVQHVLIQDYCKATVMRTSKKNQQIYLFLSIL